MAEDPICVDRHDGGFHDACVQCWKRLANEARAEVDQAFDLGKHTGFRHGMVVGAAIIAWAEAIRVRTLTRLESYKLAELALRVDVGNFVTESCRARGHGECLSYICGCPCHD